MKKYLLCLVLLITSLYMTIAQNITNYYPVIVTEYIASQKFTYTHAAIVSFIGDDLLIPNEVWFIEYNTTYKIIPQSVLQEHILVGTDIVGIRYSMKLENNSPSAVFKIYLIAGEKTFKTRE